MAATISDAGSGTDTSAGDPISTAANVVASVGDWLVVIIAACNGASGGLENIAGVSTDAEGNTFTQRAVINFGSGTGNDGATLGIFTSQIAFAKNSVVTVTFDGNNAQKSLQVYRVQPGAGETISFIATDTTGLTGNTNSYTAPTVSVTNGDIIFGAAAIETDDAITGDTDTTNGNWSSILTRLADGGADASTMSCASQHKTVSATGDQAWACTTSNNRDSARTYLVIRSAASAKTLTASGGSYAVSGTAANLRHAWKTVAAGGSYAISGTAATTELGREVAAGGGTYALGGTAAALLHTWKLAAAGGSYAITGADAALNKGKTLAAAGGSYAISGTAASLLHAWLTTAVGGSYAISGTNASLNLGKRLTLSGGSYTISGGEANLLLGLVLAAASGSYAITGADADLIHGLRLAADGGTYAISGTAVQALLGRVVAAESGSYVIAGQDADLVLAAGGGGASGGDWVVIQRRRRRAR